MTAERKRSCHDSIKRGGTCDDSSEKQEQRGKHEQTEERKGGEDTKGGYLQFLQHQMQSSTQ